MLRCGLPPRAFCFIALLLVIHCMVSGSFIMSSDPSNTGEVETIDMLFNKTIWCLFACCDLDLVFVSFFVFKTWFFFQTLHFLFICAVWYMFSATFTFYHWLSRTWFYVGCLQTIGGCVRIPAMQSRNIGTSPVAVGVSQTDRQISQTIDCRRIAIKSS